VTGPLPGFPSWVASETLPTILAGAVITAPGAGSSTATTGGKGSSGSSGFPTFRVCVATATFPERSVTVARKVE